MSGIRGGKISCLFAVDTIRFMCENAFMNKSAQRLGRLGKGVKKQLTQEERQRRHDWMVLVNRKRREAKA
jgi:hypothetical protein